MDAIATSQDGAAVVFTCSGCGREERVDLPAAGMVMCGDCGIGFDFDLAGQEGPPRARQPMPKLPYVPLLEDCPGCGPTELELFAITNAKE